MGFGFRHLRRPRQTPLYSTFEYAELLADAFCTNLRQSSANFEFVPPSFPPQDIPCAFALVLSQTMRVLCHCSIPF